METLVVAHHRNHHQYYGRSRSRSHDPTRFDSFGSAPSRNFSGITCRSFQSGAGLLPTPMNSLSTSLTKNAFAASLSPKTPSPSFKESKKAPERNAKSSSVPIPIKINFENEGNFRFSERWAGPAYSNSPPPSSLPLPKFSLPPKRTVSLHLPTLASEFDMRPMAKSAPASPTRGRSPSPNDLFDPPSPRNLFEPPSASDIFEHPPSSDMFDRADATKTLRRILNLDITHE
ncbi:hypothetical protein ACS0TY_013090 [Phlomoides rotata]